MKKSFIKIVSVLTAGTLALGGVPVMAEDNKTADLSAEDVISAQDMAALEERISPYSVEVLEADITEEEDGLIDSSLELAREECESEEAAYTEYRNASYNFQSDFFYSQLSAEARAYYQQFAAACEQAANYSVNYTGRVSTTSADGTKKSHYVIAKVPFTGRFTQDEALAVATAFFYSNPQYFFVSQLAWNSDNIYLITYDGYENGAARMAAANQIDIATSQWLAEINQGRDDLEKESIIYKKLCDSVIYNKDENGAISAGSNQTIAGALLNGRCVCNGYAMTVTYFSHLIGIDCVGIVGNNHAWNSINLGGSWYDLDVTWMDRYEVTGRYYYPFCNRGSGVFMALDSSGYHNPKESRYTNITLPDASHSNPLFITIDAERNASGSATLNWEAINGCQGYSLYRYRSGAYSQVSEFSSAYTGCTVADLQNSDGFVVRAQMWDPVTYQNVLTSFSQSAVAYVENIVQKPQITGLIAGDRSMTVNWTSVDGASRYGVYYYINGKWTCAGYTSNLYMNVTGLTNGSRYGFAVKAYVNGAWTDVTSSDMVYASPEGADKPVITSAEAGDKSVKLTWDGIDTAEKYAVYYKLDGRWTCYGYTTDLTMNVTGLTNGSSYGFAVKAYVNGAWTGVASSDIVYVSPKGADKPFITSAEAGDRSVKLTWSGVDSAERYGVYYYIGGKWSFAGYTTELTYEVSGLANGSRYGFAVKAYVNGAWTAVTSADMVYAQPAGSTVTSDKPVITSAEAGDRSVKLTWDGVDTAEKYAVYYKLDGKWTCYGYTTDLAMNVTGLTNGSSYGFAVKAYVNGAWTGVASSDIVYVSPKGADKPFITSAEAGDRSVKLTWSGVDSAERYGVYYYIGGKWSFAGYTTELTYEVSGLANGSRYGFAVKAYVNGAWTAVTSADMVYAQPAGSTVTSDKPVITKAEAGDGCVYLEWTAVEGADRYAVYSYINGTWTFQCYTDAIGINIENLANGIKYGFAVKAYVNGSWTAVTSADIVYAKPAAEAA